MRCGKVAAVNRAGEEGLKSLSSLLKSCVLGCRDALLCLRSASKVQQKNPALVSCLIEHTRPTFLNIAA